MRTRVRAADRPAPRGRGINVDVTPEQEARWGQAETRGDLAALAATDLEISAPLGADHMVQWRTPEEPARLVLEFLEA